MSSNITQFASESVCAGHPDKICDAISDAILDAILTQDPHSHAGIETIACDDRLILAGEIKTKAKGINFEEVARMEIARLGYTRPEWGFYNKSQIDSYLHQQSSEIAVGVDADGAGDQGMMFGYACKETPELMPLPITIAHALTQALDQARETKSIPYLRPDGKAQVVVNYHDNRPIGIAHVTIAIPHNEDVELETVKAEVYRQIIMPILGKYKFKIDPKNLIVNGTGVWHIPGPTSDAGLTGRKIIVDGYGGYARAGGGAFSGKDPSKVDRSGAYAARFIAKNLVAAGMADKVEVALAYYIGATRPVMLSINAFGTETTSQKTLQDFADKLIVPSVKGIIDTLKLARPIYHPTAAYGHFGRPEFPWEQIIA